MTDTTKGKEFYIDMAKSVLNFNERFGINAAADFLKTFDELSALNDTVVEGKKFKFPIRPQYKPTIPEQPTNDNAFVWTDEVA